MSSDRLQVTFPTMRKRGLIAMFLIMWDGPAMFFAMGAFTAFSGVATAINTRQWHHLSSLVAAAIMGGIGYLFYRKANQGTSWIKQFFNLRVLRKDKATSGYRYLTANEFLARQALAAVYLPFAYAFAMIPTIFGAVLGGGLASLTTSNRYQDSDYNGTMVQKYDSDQNNAKINAGTAAGAAIGATFTNKLVASFPWLFSMHDSLMSTIVIDETPESKQYFEKNKEIYFDQPTSNQNAA